MKMSEKGKPPEAALRGMLYLGGKKNTTTTSVRFARERFNRVKQYASRERLSINYVINYAVEKFLVDVAESETEQVDREQSDREQIEMEAKS